MKRKEIEQVIHKTKLPILNQFEPFKRIRKYTKDPVVLDKIKSLDQIIDREKDLILEIKSMNKEKSRMTASVLYLSNQLNAKGNQAAAKELDKIKNRIQTINQEITYKEKQIQEIIVDKEMINADLAVDAIEIAYQMMQSDEKRFRQSLKQIEELRTQLKRERDKRDFVKERMNSIYSFLYAMIGAKSMEKMDTAFLKDLGNIDD